MMLVLYYKNCYNSCHSLNIRGRIMSLSKKILEFTTTHRELLMKLLPVGMLRKIKANMIQKNLNRVKKEGKLSFERTAYPMGINFIGDVKAEIGLGQSARLVVRELEHTDIPFTVYQLDMDGNLRSNDHSCDSFISQTMPYGVNIFHINPYELGVIYSQFGKDVWQKRYNIVFWLWELQEFPEEWKACFPLVDEVWTPSEFTSSSIRKVIDVPVITIPYAMTAPVDEKYNRRYFSLPEDKILYLGMYDCNSTMGRKNPMGIIEAFKQAFPADGAEEQTRVGLVLKVNNAQDEDMQILKAALAGYDNIYFITDILTKLEVNSLIACVDVFVSLHRAEGFGLVMAEAMLNETVCIATDWSSNTEFMNNEVACMVPCRMVAIEQGDTQYRTGYHWAEPDISAAANYMKQLYQDSDYRKQKAQLAKAYLKDKLSMQQAVERMQERIRMLYNTETIRKEETIH